MTDFGRKERSVDLTNSAEKKTRHTFISLEKPRVSEPVYQEQGNVNDEPKDAIDAEMLKVVDCKKLNSS